MKRLHWPSVKPKKDLTGNLKDCSIKRTFKNCIDIYSSTSKGMMFRKSIVIKQVIDLVRGFMILLWVYTATAKLLQFDDFGVQLAQSPILSSYAGILIWLVPVSEYGVSILLVYSKTREAGLYGSLALMTAFTTYIIIILRYADFVPCSCGGILESLNWTQHLIFNGGCLVLIVCALWTYSAACNDRLTPRSFGFRIWGIGVFMLLSSALVVLLFLSSKNQIHHNNAFTRKYIPHVCNKEKAYNLGVNSYYIAGITTDSIYLGNATSPFTLVSFDKNLTDSSTTRIKLLNASDIKFRSTKIKVLNSILMLSDGTVPVIFKGDLQSRKLVPRRTPFYFTKLQPLSSGKYAFTARNAETNENELGWYAFEDTSAFKLNPQLLERQVDGIFDVEGFLTYNPQLKNLVYVYRYRNEYFLTDEELNRIMRGKLIDTISIAQLQIDTLAATGQRKLGPKTISVSHNVATSGSYLYIHSKRLGRYEHKLLKDRSILDVYDLTNLKYSHSFYLQHTGMHPFVDFSIRDKELFAICGNYLIRFTRSRGDSLERH